MSRNYPLSRRAALGLIAGGSVLTATETFGFTSLSANRSFDISVSDDPNAFIGIEVVLDGAVEGGEEDAIRLINNTGEPLSLDVDVTVGSGLNLETTFNDEVPVGEDTTMTVSCVQGSGSGFTDVEIDIRSATGDSFSVEHLSRTFSLERACSGGTAPPFFDVEIIDTNSPVEDGATLTVEATIHNTGYEADTQTVELAIDSSIVDDHELTLGGDESDTITLSWTDTDPGDYEAEVSSDDDADTTSVSVIEPGDPFFDVTITDTNAPIDAGDTLAVDALIENTGSGSGTQTIVFNVDSEEIDTTDVTDLDSGETQSVLFSYESSSEDSPEIIVSVTSDDSSDSKTVDVDDGYTYVIHDVTLSSGGGNTIDVTVDVTADNPEAVIEIFSVKNPDDVRDSIVVDAENGTYSVEGGNQADEVRVKLLDGDGYEHDSRTEPWQG